METILPNCKAHIDLVSLKVNDHNMLQHIGLGHITNMPNYRIYLPLGERHRTKHLLAAPSHLAPPPKNFPKAPKPYASRVACELPLFQVDEGCKTCNQIQVLTLWLKDFRRGLNHMCFERRRRR